MNTIHSSHITNSYLTKEKKLRVIVRPGAMGGFIRLFCTYQFGGGLRPNEYKNDSDSNYDESGI